MASGTQEIDGGGFMKVYASPNTGTASLRMSRTKFPLPTALRDTIDANQLVRITVRSSTNNEMVDIEAINQKPLAFHVKGEWVKFPSMGSLMSGAGAGAAPASAIANYARLAPAAEKIADAITRGVFGSSTRSAMGTRKMWNGSDPLGVQLSLRFEAINNANHEVLLPALKLLSLPLPSRSLQFLGGSDFFLVPPGPAPFPDNTVGKIANAISTGNVSSVKEVFKSTGEQVTIRFGGILTMTRALVSGADVVWDTRCNALGIPTAADITLTVESSEVMTKESLYEAMLGVTK